MDWTCGSIKAVLNYIQSISSSTTANLSVYNNGNIQDNFSIPLGKTESVDVNGQSISLSFTSTGGSTVNATRATFFAPISSNGIGSWMETSSYPIPLYGAYCEMPGNGGGYLSGGGPS